MQVQNDTAFLAELRADLAAFRPELRATAAAKDAARFLLLDPPLSTASRVGYAMLAAGALADLPAWARQALDIPVVPGADALFGRPLGRVSAGAVRWAMADPALAHERRARPPQ